MAKKGGTGKPQELTVETLLKSRNIIDKLKAVEILKEKRDVEGLFQLLFSESWHVREKAAEALCEWGNEIEDRTIPLLDEKFWYVRSAAASILGNVGTEKSVEPLKKHLKEKNEPVRIESAKALAKIKLKMPELYETLSDDELKLIEENLKIAREYELLEKFKKGE